MVLGLCWFVYTIYQNTTRANAENMKQVQARCAEREEKLYKQIEKNQEINAQAIATIAHYAEKLETIQADVREIKEDVIKLTSNREE